jgi:RNA polymerase sigma-70 factor (ECF subfamily)
MSDRPLTEEQLSEHIPMIRRYLSKMLRPEEIEDGTQVVLTRALENLDRFRGDSSARVWLLGIARNVGFEIARARQRHPKAGASSEGDDVGTGDLLLGDAPNQEEELGRREQQALLLAALEDMGLDEKLVLLVTYVDGLPGPEAAEILGISFAAFRQRLSRARQSLHRRLETLMKSGEPGSAEVLARWQVLLNPTEKK